MLFPAAVSNIVSKVSQNIRQCNLKLIFQEIACRFPHERHQCRRYLYRCRVHRRERRRRRYKPRPIPIEFFMDRSEKQSIQGLNLRRLFIYEDIQRVSREQSVMFMEMWYRKKTIEWNN